MPNNFELLSDLRLFAKFKVASRNGIHIDSNPEILLSRDPRRDAAFAGLLDIGFVLQHFSAAVYDDRPGCIGEYAIYFESYLFIDRHGSKFISRGGAQEELAVVHRVVHRNDID